MKNVTCERCVIGQFPADVEEEHLERYRYACRFASNANVADVACGTGYGTAMLAKAGARSVVGVDCSREAVAHAKATYCHPNLAFAVGNAERLEQLSDNSVDLFVSFETIEHLHLVDEYLAEVSRVLRPGGRFLVSTPDRRLASSLYPLRGRPNNPYHVREYTDLEFRRTLERRFTIEEFSGQAFVHPVLVFWPLHVALKTACYMTRRWGTQRFIRDHYHVGTGLAVETSYPRKRGVARFWVAFCRKSFEAL